MRSRGGPIWISLPCLVGACAALLVPGQASNTAAGAALLAVGAIALLAGHAWGLMVSIPSHVTLVGRVWPALTAGPATSGAAGSSATAAAVAIVIVTALPALALTAVVLPQIATHVLGAERTRAHSLFVGAAAAALVASLVLPAL